MNMIKKNGGFTLVELIVVIAILAILAAIAVPAYSGYIAKANEAADYTQLDAIKTAAIFAYTEKHPEVTVENIKVTANPFTVEVNVDVTETVNGSSVSVSETFGSTTNYLKPYYTAESLTLKTGKASATWKNVDDAATANVDESKWQFAD